MSHGYIQAIPWLSGLSKVGAFDVAPLYIEIGDVSSLKKYHYSCLSFSLFSILIASFPAISYRIPSALVKIKTSITRKGHFPASFRK